MLYLSSPVFFCPNFVLGVKTLADIAVRAMRNVSLTLGFTQSLACPIIHWTIWELGATLANVKIITSSSHLTTTCHWVIIKFANFGFVHFRCLANGGLGRSVFWVVRTLADWVCLLHLAAVAVAILTIMMEPTTLL